MFSHQVINSEPPTDTQSASAMASPQDHDDTYRAFDDFGFEDRQVLSELGRFQGRVNDEAYNDIHSDTLRCLCSLNYLQVS